MESSDLRIILVCREGESRAEYLVEIQAMKINVDVVNSFPDLYKKMFETPYNGVLIDLATNLKTPREQKELGQDILGAFPVIQLKWDSEARKIHTLFYGQTSHEGQLIDFINDECRNFPARSIRSSVRKAVHFNVIISRDAHFSEANGIRTVTINVSRGGCFIYSAEEWDNGTAVWIIMKDLEDQTPIHCEVRWSIPWGKATVIPGIGLLFKEIKESQLDLIAP